MSGKSVAIVGVTGAVGGEFLKVLEQRRFPVNRLKCLASARSAGKQVTFQGEALPVEELTEKSFAGVELALFSAGGSISKRFAPAATAAGCVVVDNSSAFRMDDNVPLIVPEINPGDVNGHGGIIANPNCSTIIMVVPVWPLHQKFKVRRIVCATYQAASGAGARAMQELETQTRAVLDGLDTLDSEQLKPSVFPHRIAFNLFSHDSPIGADGYCEEERKMVHETRKIFHDPEIRVTATCVRVPIFRAHAEAINLEFAREVDEAEARAILAAAPGIKLVDDRANNHFPMPIEASGQDHIHVGRVRRDISQPNGRGLEIFVAGDQILKGAALNAVQIAELL